MASIEENLMDNLLDKYSINKTRTMANTESIFMQMHNGTLCNQGSFNVGLQQLFYLAAKPNRVKLVKAFPEFFGEEVPEFGIDKIDIK